MQNVGQPFKSQVFCWRFWELNCGIARSELDGTRWCTGGEVKGKDANGVGSHQPCTVLSSMHTRQSSTQSDKYQVSHRCSYFSWWWAHSHPKHVEKRNKHTKKNCAPSWLYLQDLLYSLSAGCHLYVVWADSSCRVSVYLGCCWFLEHISICRMLQHPWAICMEGVALQLLPLFLMLCLKFTLLTVSGFATDKSWRYFCVSCL